MLYWILTLPTPFKFTGAVPHLRVCVTLQPCCCINYVHTSLNFTVATKITAVAMRVHASIHLRCTSFAIHIYESDVWLLLFLNQHGLGWCTAHNHKRIRLKEHVNADQTTLLTNYRQTSKQTN